MRGLLVLICLLLAAPQAAQAGKYADWEQWLSSGNGIRATARRPYRGTVAGGVALAPVYLGSDVYEAKPLPLLEVVWRERLFISTQQGIGYDFWRNRRFRAGPRLTADLGRDSGDEDKLRGLPDIDTGIEAGLFAEYFVGAFRFRGDLRQEIASGHGGFLVNVDLARGQRIASNTSLFLGGRLTYMGDEYAESYFGVKAADAAAGRPAFSAASGVRDVTAYAQLVFDLTQSVFISLDGRASLLLGDAADSPLTDSEVQYVGGALLGFRF